jgi:hypothetical protein
MGYQGGATRWMAVDDVTLLAEQQVTASGTGPARETDRGVARLTLDVAASDGDGTETLDVDVETSEDQSSWRTVGSFSTAGSGVSSERQCFAGLDRFVRVSYTLGGTVNSYTFSVAGEFA